MDVTNPLRSLTPTVDADVLAVLVKTHAPLTGARVHQLAGRSYAQVRQVLHRLVNDGLVEAVRHGKAVSYTLNRDHVLAAALEQAAGADAETERRLRSAFATWSPAPTAAVLFGSFARRDGGADSDVDLLLIRPDDVDEDDPAWTARRYEVSRSIARWTGNTAQIVELTDEELAKAVRRRDKLIANLRRDGQVLIGPDLSSLLGRPVARRSR
ncbi:MAG: nucleotidyltransferase domain-containing protein [Acidimicrobiia bacterium]